MQHKVKCSKCNAHVRDMTISDDLWKGMVLTPNMLGVQNELCSWCERTITNITKAEIV